MVSHTVQRKNILRLYRVFVGAFVLCALMMLKAGFGKEECFADSDIVGYSAGGNVNRTPSVDPVGRDEGFTAVLYDNTNGLPTSEANAIAETEDGFIWIGSYAGLIRYDGNVFERMDSTEGLTSIKCLYVDSRDRLWIGTNDNGVAVMEQGKLRKWGKLDGLKSAHTRAITEDGNGTIYVATACGITMIDSDYNVSSLDDPAVAEADMRDVRIGCDGIIYGATDLGDIVLVKDGKLLRYISGDENPLTACGTIFPDPENPGKLYHEATDLSLYYVDLTDGFEVLQQIDIEPLKYIKGMEYIDGRVWICAGNGIGVLENGKMSLVDNLPVNNNVGHVMTDYMGNLWFTSTRQGVMKVVPNQFSDLFARYDLPQAVVNATCRIDGKLFAATDTGLMVLDDNGPVSSIPLSSAKTADGTALEADDLISFLEGVRIRSVIRDSHDRLWISTWRASGLLRYDHGSLVAFSEADGLLSSSIRSVSECEDGRILVAVTGGVNVIEGDKVIASYGKEDGIENTESLTVTEGVDHDIVLGSNGGGIYIIDETGVKKTINVEEGLPSDIVMRLKWDLDHEFIWIVTSSAIAYMTPDYNVTTIQKFPYPNNFDIYENRLGDVWVLSSNGIYVTPKEEMMANGELSPVFYGVASGIPCIATANSYSELTNDGELYIAGSTGIGKVNIEEPFENVNELKAGVPFVDVDGVRVYPDENGTITIPSTTRKLTVSGFVYTYSLSDPQVSYKLNGFDTQFTTLNRDELTPVVYTNLRGGTYYFVMQLKDSMGRGNKEITVKVVKEKAFYEKTWFYVLVLLLLVSAVVMIVRLYIRWRMRAVEKKQQEAREQFEQTAEALANAIDAKDTYTNGHSRRVAKYSRKIAEAAGKSEEECDQIYFAALLHDVGKIGVSIDILTKNGKLTDEEFEEIKQHPVMGGQILSSIKKSPWLSIGAKFHHERYDGKGYPDKLAGVNIPEIARIIAVADSYDAMTSNRSYRNAIPQHVVREELVKGSGTQFDPRFAGIMIHMIDLDTEYKMKESVSGAKVTATTSLSCESIYNDCTEGIRITRNKAKISFCSQPDSAVAEKDSLPTLLVFDSLDTKVHPGEEENRNLMYLEYARIRLDGEIAEENVRKAEVRKIERMDESAGAHFATHEPGQWYRVDAVRNEDHICIHISGEKGDYEVILALPDTSRYAYISITGEHCEIHNIRIKTEMAITDADDIPRIAEKISYIKDLPIGDIPNVQVDGPRLAMSDSIPIREGMTLSFHSRSYPTARLVWHCPYVSVFSSSNGKRTDEDFCEYLVLRLDGESWEPGGLADSNVQVERKDSFVGWDSWKDINQQGMDCRVTVTREKKVVTIQTENSGIAIKSVTTFHDNAKNLFVALTGDQCAISDIHVSREI